MSRKLLVIGLDGYEPSVGEAMMRGGRLPALARLAERSARLRLEHGAARRTGLAWEHFSSGLTPEASGRWSAVEFDPIAYRCQQRGTALAPFPARLDIDTVVFDPPYFDLERAPSVSGVVGWGAHDPGIGPQSRPRDLLDQIPAYPATRWVYGYTWPSEAATKEMGGALIQGAEQRAESARWLLTDRHPDWDLGIVVVSEPHSAIEALWHGVDERHPLHNEASAPWARWGLEGTFEAVDRLVDTLVSSCPDASVLVFSMHGMGPNRSDVASMSLLAELMYRRHAGKALLDVPVSEGIPTVGEHESWPDVVGKHFPKSPREIAAACGVRPRRHRWLRALTRRRLQGVSSPTSPMLWMPAIWYAEHWSEMDAFALPSFYDGQVRINLVGREARGRVPLARYEALCTEIEADVRACTDPATGRGVVQQVSRRTAADATRLGHSEADLIFVWEGGAQAFAHPRHGLIGPLPQRRPGGHTGGAGIALFAAPEVTPGDHGTRSSFDVVPSIIEYATGATPRGVSGESFLSAICG